MSLSFDNPFILIISLFIVPLSVFILSRLKNPYIAAIPLGAPGGSSFNTSGISGFVKLLKVLEAAGFFFLFVSAAGPSVKTTETVWLSRGADIIFILDVSPSMAAIDMDGVNRFTAARNLLINFIQKRESDNIGLIAAGNDAALLVPPTSDREALFTRLNLLRIGELGDGTALGTGIAAAAYHLDKSNARRKAAIIITDGENNAGAIDPETAATLLRDAGVSFYVIAVGTAGEVPIDYFDPYTRIRRTGIFDSRYDINSLRRLSDAGGGTFISAPSADALIQAFNLVDEAELTVMRSRVIYKRKSIFMQFFIPSVLLLILIKFIRQRILGALI